MQVFFKQLPLLLLTKDGAKIGPPTLGPFLNTPLILNPKLLFVVTPDIGFTLELLPLNVFFLI